jgi:hypothetical protein
MFTTYLSPIVKTGSVVLYGTFTYLFYNLGSHGQETLVTNLEEEETGGYKVPA